MALVENRRFLIWSAVVLVAYILIAIIVNLYDLVLLRTVLTQPVLEIPLVVATLLCISSTALSGLIHAFSHKRYFWLLLLLVLPLVAPHIYGFWVASHDYESHNAA